MTGAVRLALRWGVAFITSFWVLKKNYQEQDAIGPMEPWESMTLGEKISHAQQIPLKEMAVLITLVYGVTSITRSFVDYKTK